jgi:hypothetical protein
VEACPTGALLFGDLDDPESELAKLVASGRTEALRLEYGLGDKVRYIGLPKRFIAGAVVYGDTDKCGEGAKVTLRGLQPPPGPPDASRAVVADNYGDFEFEGLPPDQAFTVRIEAAGYASRELVARTNQDVYLGEIVLAPLGAAPSGAPPAAAGDAAPGAARTRGADNG